MGKITVKREAAYASVCASKLAVPKTRCYAGSRQTLRKHVDWAHVTVIPACNCVDEVRKLLKGETDADAKSDPNRMRIVWEDFNPFGETMILAARLDVLPEKIKE